MNHTYEYTKIRENIWQIEDDMGVRCTLIKGSELAVLIDTGYGERNLRHFVEESVSTPYMVINSHGHPDHIGGNHWFDTIYAIKEEWDVIQHFEEFLPEYANLDELKAHYSRGGLGDVKVKKFLNNVLQSELAPIRERRKEWEKDIPAVFDILKAGSDKARAVAAQTLKEVKDAMKINYFDDIELIKKQAEKYK